MYLAKPLPDRQSLIRAFNEKQEVTISGIEITGKEVRFTFSIMSLTTGPTTVFFFGKSPHGVVSGYVDYGFQNGGIAEEI